MARGRAWHAGAHGTCARMARTHGIDAPWYARAHSRTALPPARSGLRALKNLSSRGPLVFSLELGLLLPIASSLGLLQPSSPFDVSYT
eukprot:4543751-Pleurochrysis_carterae.AAC.1